MHQHCCFSSIVNHQSCSTTILSARCPHVLVIQHRQVLVDSGCVPAMWNNWEVTWSICRTLSMSIERSSLLRSLCRGQYILNGSRRATVRKMNRQLYNIKKEKHNESIETASSMSVTSNSFPSQARYNIQSRAGGENIPCPPESWYGGVPSTPDISD